MLSIRTMLHPTDFSEHSANAFQFACALAHDFGARLIVLHVEERPLIAYPGVAMAPPPLPPSKEERVALLAKLQQVRSSDAEIQVEHRLEQGDPTTGILEVAQEVSCDLIVLGSHGRTGLNRLLMGSVAEGVMRAAPCPVLTVKTPLPEHHAAVRTHPEHATK